MTEMTKLTPKSVVFALVGSDTVPPVSRSESGFDLLDRSDRKVVRDALRTRFDHLMGKGPVAFDDAAKVWAVMSVLDTPARSAKVVTDDMVRSLVAEKVAMLRFAADALFAGSVPISGWDGESPILDESDIPDLSDEQCETATKRYAMVGTGSKSKENDIPSLIAETYADWTTGTFRTVREIREAIGANHPELHVSAEWDGRLSASLFGTKAAERYETDIQPVSSGSNEAREHDAKGRAGAIRK